MCRLGVENEHARSVWVRPAKKRGETVKVEDADLLLWQKGMPASSKAAKKWGGAVNVEGAVSKP